MATYMQANQPYQRVAPDSVMNGAAIGAGISAAGIGATHFLTNRSARKASGVLGDYMASSNDMRNEQLKRISLDQAQTNYDNNRSVQRRNRYFGSGVRGAVTYGAGLALGGAIGAGIDATI